MRSIHASLLCLLALAAGLPQAGAEEKAPVWKSLFDGKTLQGWAAAKFGGEGKVAVKEGRIVLQPGETLTGITFTGKDFPVTNYEISLEAMRVDGIDFFCGLTFPVKKSHCSFIVGGWAGAVVGLSNSDDKDASENDTTKYMDFKTGRWYRIRVRVTDQKITCWIDKTRVVDQPLKGRRISIRPEVDLCKPLGISAWQTKAALRNIRWRRVAP